VTSECVAKKSSPSRHERRPSSTTLDIASVAPQSAGDRLADWLPAKASRKSPHPAVQRVPHFAGRGWDHAPVALGSSDAFLRWPVRTSTLICRSYFRPDKLALRPGQGFPLERLVSEIPRTMPIASIARTVSACVSSLGLRYLSRTESAPCPPSVLSRSVSSGGPTREDRAMTQQRRSE
jgi:hypothetical protein